MPPPGRPPMMTPPPAGQDDVYKFMMDVKEVTPTIPDAIMDNIMAQAGLYTTDVSLTRTLSIACQKFISEILNDLQAGRKQDCHTASFEDIKQALEKRNIRSYRPEYLVGEMENEPEEINDFGQGMDFGFQDDW